MTVQMCEFYSLYDAALYKNRKKYVLLYAPFNANVDCDAMNLCNIV